MRCNVSSSLYIYIYNTNFQFFSSLQDFIDQLEWFLDLLNRMNVTIPYEMQNQFDSLIWRMLTQSKTLIVNVYQIDGKPYASLKAKVL